MADSNEQTQAEKDRAERFVAWMEKSPAWNDHPDMTWYFRRSSKGCLSLVVNNAAPKGSAADLAAQKARSGLKTTAANKAIKSEGPISFSCLPSENNFDDGPVS